MGSLMFVPPKFQHIEVKENEKKNKFQLLSINSFSKISLISFSQVEKIQSEYFCKYIQQKKEKNRKKAAAAKEKKKEIQQINADPKTFAKKQYIHAESNCIR